jgi:hypothetical protein
MNPTTAVRSKLYPVLTAPTEELATARAEALIETARELGVPASAYLAAAYVTDDGTIGTSAHLIAARIDASERYRFRPVVRSPFRVLLEFLERDAYALDTWATRCAGTCGLLETRRGDRPELCRGCRGGVVVTEIDAGWRWRGDADWTLERARAAGVTQGDAWKDPLTCLWVRALSEGARHHCPALFGGAVYGEGEVPQLGAERHADDSWAPVPRDSVAMGRVLAEARARSFGARGLPASDRVEWRGEDVVRFRWRDGRWLAFRFSVQASKKAGEERWLALEEWPAVQADLTGGAGDERTCRLHGAREACSCPAMSEVLGAPDTVVGERQDDEELDGLDVDDTPFGGGEESGPVAQAHTKPIAPSSSTAGAETAPPPTTGPSASDAGPDLSPPAPAAQLSGGDGALPGAPLGGECGGAVVEPPASEDCPSGAGAPPAHECTCSANLLMLTGLVHQDGCPYAKAPAPASDEEDPDAWRSRVSPEVAARYDALDAAERDADLARIRVMSEDERNAWLDESDSVDEAGRRARLLQEVAGEERAELARILAERAAAPSRCAECDAPLAADSFECPDPECPTNAGPQEGPTLPTPDWMRDAPADEDGDAKACEAGCTCERCRARRDGRKPSRNAIDMEEFPPELRRDLWERGLVLRRATTPGRFDLLKGEEVVAAVLTGDQARAWLRENPAPPKDDAKDEETDWLPGFGGVLYLDMSDPQPLHNIPHLGPKELERGQVVHVMSRPAKGEVRGYVLAGSKLYHRTPKPHDWPEVDRAVCELLECEADWLVDEEEVAKAAAAVESCLSATDPPPAPADLRGQKRAAVLAKAAQRQWDPVTVKRGGGVCASGCGVQLRKGDEAEESGSRRRHKTCPTPKDVPHGA